jgi:hypothetical protein
VIDFIEATKAEVNEAKKEEEAKEQLWYQPTLQLIF